MTDALLMPADGPKDIPDDAVNIIERFVILPSGCRRVAAESAAGARKLQFSA